MKQIITILFVAMLSTNILTAQTFQIGGINYNIISANTVEVIKNLDYAGDIIIPNQVNYNNATYSVISIKDNAFYNLPYIASITIPNSVISIGEFVFHNCIGLMDINVALDNPNYASIGGILYNKDIETLIQYPAGKTLTTFTTPSSVTSIGDWAFAYCEDLTSVTIDNSVTSIGDWAFYECVGLTSVTIGNSVASVGESAFNSCTGLASITIPNSVISIGEFVFHNCIGLMDINVALDNPNYASIDGVLYNKDITTLVQYPAGKPLNTFTTIGSVTSIGYGAFASCIILDSIIISNSVTNIGDYAFFDCSGLSSIIISNTIGTIGEYAFYNCIGLTSIIIPNSIDTIKNYAFVDCTGLTEIMCNAIELPSIGEDIFINVPQNIPLYVPSGSVDLYKDAEQWEDFNIEANPFLPYDADTIEGLTTVCQGQSDIVYTVPVITNASSYIWTLPNGIIDTIDTNSITINYSINANSGNISVQGTNNIGEGVLAKIAITVNPKPANPVVTLTNDSVISSNITTGNQWHNNAGVIANATSQTYTVTQNDAYYTIVTQNGCSSDTSNIINVTLSGIDEKFSIFHSSSSINIFPNPTSGLLNIKIRGNVNEVISVYNIVGKELLRGEVNAVGQNYSLDLSNFDKGIYFLKIGEFVSKIVKE